jgi:hypothetical protein
MFYYLQVKIIHLTSWSIREPVKGRFESVFGGFGSVFGKKKGAGEAGALKNGKQTKKVLN